MKLGYLVRLTNKMKQAGKNVSAICHQWSWIDPLAMKKLTSGHGKHSRRLRKWSRAYHRIGKRFTAEVDRLTQHP